MRQFIKSDNASSVELDFHDMPFWLPCDYLSLWKPDCFAVTLSGKLCSLEKQVECIRKFSELKVEPVLVNQPVHMGLLIHLNSFMDPDSEISRGKKACFQSSFLLDHHNEGWHSQGLFLARNLLLRLCLVIYQNYLTGRLPFYFLMAYL